MEWACASAKGVDYSPLDLPQQPLYDVSQEFGVWTVDQASKFGFVRPSPTEDLRANNVDVDGGSPASTPRPPERFVGDLPQQEQRIAFDCRKSEQWKQFDLGRVFRGGPWAQALSDASESAIAGDAARTAIGEYHTCLASKGLEPHPELVFAVKGADFAAISAEQIELALQVVACKDRVDLIRRMADIVAAAQAPIIEKYATELSAQKERMDALRLQAKSYLAEHGAL